ncbi:MAG: hypothetical protein ACI936_002622 [Paraglaciecola sp.]|jgi:hypothetical protein
MTDLYAWATPNGLKASSKLEGLGLDYCTFSFKIKKLKGEVDG